MNRCTRLRPLVLVIALAALLGATPLRAGDDTVYAALGGEAGIRSLTDTLLREMAEDPRIVRHFRETNIARFRRLFVEHLCAITGGPCEYTGDSLRVSHRHLDISDGDFNAVVEALWDAMEREGLPVATQNRVLALLAPLKADVTGR